MRSEQKRVDYDRVAPNYNRRYATGEQPGVMDALCALAQEVNAAHILEAGCGTGHWLARLHGELAPRVAGLDYSAGMLRQAQARRAPLRLVQGKAGVLPFAAARFDLVYCVNAIHHFDQQARFIAEARRLLRPGGALAVIGLDPRASADAWYIYEFFAGTYETDLARFPAWETVRAWMAAAGFTRTGQRRVSHVRDDKIGRAVLSDPFVQKDQTSQLTLLSDEAYAAGLRKLAAAVEAAEAAGETRVFPVDIRMEMAVGFAPHS